MRASRQLILLTRMVGSALRANEFGLFAKVSAHVVKTRASDSKFCVPASKVKFRLAGVRLSASIFDRLYPAIIGSLLYMYK